MPANCTHFCRSIYLASFQLPPMPQRVASGNGNRPGNGHSNGNGNGNGPSIGIFVPRKWLSTLVLATAK